MLHDIFCERLTGNVKNSYVSSQCVLHLFVRNILISIFPKSFPLLDHSKYFSGLESTILINGTGKNPIPSPGHFFHKIYRAFQALELNLLKICQKGNLSSSNPFDRQRNSLIASVSETGFKLFNRFCAGLICRMDDDGRITRRSFI